MKTTFRIFKSISEGSNQEVYEVSSDDNLVLPFPYFVCYDSLDEAKLAIESAVEYVNRPKVIKEEVFSTQVEIPSTY